MQAAALATQAPGAEAELRSWDGLLTALADALPGLLRPSGAPTASVGDVCELLQLLPPLLQRDASPTRLGALLFAQQGDRGDLIQLLFRYLTAPLAHAPGAPSAEEAQRHFTALRVLLLRTLARVLSLASPPAAGDPASAALAEAAGRAVGQARGAEVLLGIICGGPHVAEEAKVATVECLFVFLMRNAHGKHALVSCPGGIAHLLGVLRSEPSPMVRNYTAACIRELANAYPSHITGSDFPGMLSSIICKDSSKDVRVLAMETFDVVLRADSSFLPGFSMKRELAEALGELLRGDDDREVRDIACRLLSTIFVQEGRHTAAANSADAPLESLPATLTAHWVSAEGYRHMLRAHDPSGRVAGMAARAFRHLVQHAPWQLQLGHRLIDNWAAVGALLKALQPAAAPAADDVDAQIPLVELAIALGIMLSQSPHTREALHRELAGFPAWLPTLRAALLSHLNRAALEYYDGIDIWDGSGRLLNGLDSVQWDDPPPGGGPRRPKKASVRQIFTSQEQRFVAGGSKAAGGIPPSTQYEDAEAAAQKRMRLTFIVLSYAIHIALSPAPAPAPAPHAPHAPPQPAGPELRAPSSTATSSSSSEAATAATPQPPAPAAWQNPAAEAAWAAPQPPPGAWGGAHARAGAQQQPQPWAEGAWQPAAPPPPAAAQWGPAGPPPPQQQPLGPPPSACGSARRWDPGVDPTAAIPCTSPRPGGPLPPLYPSYPSSLDPAAAAVRSVRRPAQSAPPAAAPPDVFSKFDDALKLAAHFAQYHNRRREPGPVYRPTPDGYMIRQSRVKDPWCPIVARKPLKSWSVRDLREGDLFYFSIPFGELTVDAVERVSSRAARHLTNVKRLFLTTPQKAKGRRWFLFDMLNNIVPGIRDSLAALTDLLQQHGEENVKFPLLMFREREMHEGERTVHPGNIVEITDQIRFYFLQQPGDLAGVNSTYVRDLDARIRALASQEFTGHEDDLSDSSTEDDNVPGQPGDSSSESDD